MDHVDGVAPGSGGDRRPDIHPAAWHARRAAGIGSSDIAGILEVSPWQSPYAVWCSKTGGGGGWDDGKDERQRWGNLLEDAVLTEAARRLGLTVTGRQVECQHPAYPWALATVDGTYADEPAGPDAGLIEVKTSYERWDRVPVQYEAQVQWQLEVRQLPRAWVACLHNGSRLTLWRVDRDEQVGARLLAVAGRFWERHVLAGSPPPIDGMGSTTTALARRYAASVPELVADAGPVAGQLSRLREIDQLAAALKAERAVLANQVRAHLGAAEGGVLDGSLVVTLRASSRRTVDTTRLRDERPDIAEDYTKTSPVRTLRLTGEGSNDDDQ